MTIIAPESWAAFYPDCLSLFAEHHAEIVDEAYSTPLDPDIGACAAADKSGNVLILVARKETKMVGYAIFFISRNIMSKNVIIATQAPYFVTKDQRKYGIGFKLYREAIKILKHRGVHILYPHHWLTGDSARLGSFFEHLGAKEIQHEYSLNIGVH